MFGCTALEAFGIPPLALQRKREHITFGSSTVCSADCLPDFVVLCFLKTRPSLQELVEALEQGRMNALEGKSVWEALLSYKAKVPC